MRTLAFPAFLVGAALASPVVLWAANRIPGPARDEATCGRVRMHLVPLRRVVGRDHADLADGFDLPSTRRFISHDFSASTLVGANDIGFVFFSGSARYNLGSGTTPRTEVIEGSITGRGHFDERYWRSDGRLSDIDHNGQLQINPLVSGVSTALAYMKLGAKLDAALARGGTAEPPFPVVRGTSDFRYWYAPQRAVPGSAGMSGQSLARARFAQIGSRTFVVTNRPYVIAAEIRADGHIARYFSCEKTMA